MKLNYGTRIKNLREKDNITQKQIAEAIEIKRSSFKQFEQQYDIIPIKRLNQVANYFNVSIDYLLELTNELNYNNSKKNINMDLASERLKLFRKEKKLTQEKLADVLKISRSVIVYHENKRTTLGTPFLAALCHKYHISADYLLGKVDNPKYLK